MKLGVGYIAFTGLEFLKPSLLNIRPYAHHIVVITSAVSHSGHPLPEYALPLINQLMDEGLIDAHLQVDVGTTSVPVEMQDRCRQKREMAREHCQIMGCSHFLIRDCDEFHEPEQLKNIIESGDLERNDITTSSLYEYWGTPILRAKEIGKLRVPFIQKVYFPLKNTMTYGERVDRGRTCVGWASKKQFIPEELIMHHFTACRYNPKELRRKWQGHGHLNRVYKDPDRYVSSVAKLVKDNATVMADDTFGIMDYWQEEWPALMTEWEQI